MLEAGYGERHVEPESQQQALAGALLGGQLLERARRRRTALERVDEPRERRPVGAPFEPERRDGSDADAEVVAPRPVGEIVLSAPVVAAEVRGLVPAVAGRGEALGPVLLVVL
jgi:hypothetical protein